MAARKTTMPDLVPTSSGLPWRTETFRELNRPLVQLLGDETAKPLAGLGLFTVADLMEHLPRRYLSGTETTDLSALRPGTDAAVVARVADVARRGHDPQRLRLEAVLTDGRADLTATFFGRERLIGYWEHQLRLGVKGIFVGKVGVFRHQLQMSHPDFVMLDEAGAIVGWANATRQAMARQVSRSGLVGIYPASAKLPTWRVAECADMVLSTLGGLVDPVPEPVRRTYRLMPLRTAYTEIHRPVNLANIADAQRRLKFDEALRLQLVMAYRRADQARHHAPPIVRRDGGLLDRFDARLPFTLTAGQVEVSRDIFADLAQARPMQRLLQGEVGSGKTVVALRAMLAAVDAGKQAVLLAPTEVLATQHYESITSLLGDLAGGGMLGAAADATDVVLLTGSATAIRRRNTLNKIASGDAGLVIGTHALLQAGVRFAGLGLVVVDEQHRFGVEQRAVLAEGASGGDDTHPHVLVMTATPIPRSVAMTIFGDLAVSTLTELPLGRQDVQTTMVSTRVHPAWLDRAWERVREEVAAGRQAFVIAPRINAAEADASDPDDPDRPPSATVEALGDQLREGPLAGLRLETLHGRMPAEAKRDIMGRFAAGEVDVLVATTVVEVGVDVPNASIMVVMDADRFGISQLHQLRGRIGRGEHKGVCLLVTAADPGGPAAARLAAVARTRDGFKLAEVDLEQRREGNVLGATQSGGRSTLRLLRAIADADLIAQARDVANELVAADPERADPFLADMVTQVEAQAADEWLERA